jgi:hypothetical protein
MIAKRSGGIGMTVPIAPADRGNLLVSLLARRWPSARRADPPKGSPALASGSADLPREPEHDEVSLYGADSPWI